MINKIGSQISFKAVTIDKAVAESAMDVAAISEAYKILDDTFTPMGLDARFSLQDEASPDGALVLNVTSPDTNQGKKGFINWNPFHYLTDGAVEEFQDAVDRLWIKVKESGLDIQKKDNYAIQINNGGEEGIQMPDEYKAPIKRWAKENYAKYNDSPLKVVIEPVVTGSQGYSVIPRATLYNKTTGDLLRGMYIGLNGTERDLARLDEIADTYLTIYNQGIEIGKTLQNNA